MLGVTLCLVGAGCGGGSPTAGENPKRFGIRLLPPSVASHLPAGSRSGRPNIVFVLTDDLSLELLRFMPHVLAMKRNGLTFRDYFVSDSLCCPSRASIFTGDLPHDTHIFTNTVPDGGFRAFYRRGEERHTFAVVLQRSGYLTAMMGKYLNGYLQNGRGRVDGAAADVTNSYVPPGWNEWDVAGLGYREFNYRMNEGGVIYHFGHQPQDYLTDVLARKGVEFIHAAAERGQPFFLELATYAPHSPYVPAPRNAHDFPDLTAPQPPNFDAIPSHAPLWLLAHPPLTSSQITRINQIFRRRAQSVEAVDRMIGEIQHALRANGLTRDTYVVFSSDNGLHTGEYRLMPGKLTAFDTDIHVPLIVTGPGVRPGTTRDMTENIDLAKTFAAIGGTQLRGDGHGLLSLLHGRTPAKWRNAALIEHHSPRRTILDPDYQQPPSGEPTKYEAMRTHNYLYVENADGERELYDLRRDPFELHNIFGRLSRRQRFQLHREMRSVEHCHGSSACWRAMHLRPLPGRL
jgi:arylsulfatase A-like enzyme